MKKYLIIFLSLFIILTFNSCKKEGCTDSSSINYDSEAKKDDNSCEYEANVSFWFNESVSGFLVSYQATTLTVYIDNVSVGTIDVNDWKSGPDCGGANFTVLQKMGKSKSSSYSYSVIDQKGTKHFSGSFTLSAQDCLNIQLKW